MLFAFRMIRFQDVSHLNTNPMPIKTSVLPLIVVMTTCLVPVPSSAQDNSVTAAAEPADAKQAQRPNILFIMSDDHTAQAVGAFATLLKDLNPTPNIDQLARGGMCFDNAFCTNSICTPSRACIITGQYNHINGVFDLGGRIVPAKQMLPIQMKNAGYQTAMIGKWHLKVEPNYDYYKVLPGQGKYFDTIFRIQGDKPLAKKTPSNTKANIRLM